MKRLNLLLLNFLILLPFITMAQKEQKGVTKNVVKVSFNELLEFDKSAVKFSKPIFKKPKNPNVPRNINATKPKNIIFKEASFRNDESFKYVSDKISPDPVKSFLGLDDNFTSIPPDVNGAAGPNHLMVTLNTEVRIMDKEGNATKTVSLGNFFSKLPGGHTFDPKIIYDYSSERWVITCCSGSDPSVSRIYLAISENSDPTGNWYMYYFDSDPTKTNWLDYPSMGINKNWIVISGNMFSSGGSSRYPVIYVINKNDAYTGKEDVSYKRISVSSGDGFTITPAVTYDNDLEEVYCLATSYSSSSSGKSYTKLYEISGEVNDPKYDYLGSLSANISYSRNPAHGGSNFLPQKGSSAKVCANDARMQKTVLRNGKIYGVHNCWLPAGSPTHQGVAWWCIDVNEKEIIERGFIEDPDANRHYAFPSIAVNANEDILVGFSVFGEDIYPSAGYAIKYADNEENVFCKPIIYKEGLSSYLKDFGDSGNRWGDYTATVLDPNGLDFWTLQELAINPKSGTDAWSTWWANIQRNIPPVVNISASYNVIPVGQSIDFNSLCSGNPTSWEWTFEGGKPETSTEEHPKGIKYDKAGKYKVTLTAKNDIGNTEKVFENFIDVNSTIIPTPKFIADKQTVCIGDTVKFTDQTKELTTEWEWEFAPNTVDFIDGTDKNSRNPVVKFKSVDKYDVILTTSNSNGNKKLEKKDFIFSGSSYAYEDDKAILSESFSKEIDTKGWTIKNPDNSFTWKTCSYMQSGVGTHKFIGIDHHSYNKYRKRDFLISPILNFDNEEAITLSFRHASALKSNSDVDTLGINISTDCGQTWERVATFYGNTGENALTTVPAQKSKFLPKKNSDWCGSGDNTPCKKVDLSKYKGGNIQIAFESFACYGAGMYIDDIKIEKGLGVDEIENIALTVFPNPSNGIYSFETNGNVDNNRCEIVSLSGQILKTITFNKSKSQKVVDISNFNDGVYLVRYRVNDILYTKKIVKK
ncbi:MAG: PKD domain-containing protein [Hyphomicrobiales bacterium]